MLRLSVSRILTWWHYGSCNITLLLIVREGRAAQVVSACQPGCEKMERECENVDEIEREWGNGRRFTLYIFSFYLYFLPLYPFLITEIVSFCRKMLNMTLFVANVTKKTYHTRYEKISLGRIRCESALQVVPAWKMTICMKRKVQEQKPGAALVSATVPRRIGGSLKLIAHVFCVPYASIVFITNHREIQRSDQVREKI